MWYFGTVLASLVFKREPFFRISDDITDLQQESAQLQELARHLGWEELMVYNADASYIEWEAHGLHVPEGTRVVECPLEWYVDEGNRDRACEDAVDVVKKLLRYDPKVSADFSEPRVFGIGRC